MSTPLPLPDAVKAWREAWAWYGVMALLGIAVFAPTYAAMIKTWWQSSTFYHCFFILPISGWLIWERRAEWLQWRPKPAHNSWALLAALFCLLWILSMLAGILLFQEVLALSLLIGAFYAVVGPRIAKQLWFPLLFAFFSIPAGESLIPWLQDTTASMSVFGLHLAGIPVLLEGRVIQIPSGDFVVEKACSGIRYLIASLAVGSLFAYMFYRKPWKWIVFLAACVVVPVLANGFRAFLIIMLAHMSGMKIATGVDHFIYGWFFFSVIMLLMLWAGFQFRDPHTGHAASVEIGKAYFSRVKPFRVPALFYAGCLSATAIIYYVLLAHSLAARDISLTLPEFPGWERTGIAATDFPRFVHVSDRAAAVYRRNGAAIEVYLGYFAASDRDAEMINSEHEFVSAPWTMQAADRLRLRLSKGDIDAHALLLASPAMSHKRLVLYWYDVGGRMSAGELSTKWQETLALLRRDNSGAVMWVLAGDFDTHPDEIVPAMQELLTALAPAVQKLIWQNVP